MARSTFNRVLGDTLFVAGGVASSMIVRAGLAEPRGPTAAAWVFAGVVSGVLAAGTYRSARDKTSVGVAIGFAALRGTVGASLTTALFLTASLCAPHMLGSLSILLPLILSAAVLGGIAWNILKRLEGDEWRLGRMLVLFTVGAMLLALPIWSCHDSGWGRRLHCYRVWDEEAWVPTRHWH